MTTIRLYPVVIDTFGLIFGVRVFLEEIERALPDAEGKALDYLNQLAKEQKWEEFDYSLEEAEIKSKFKHWLPRLTGYSAVTLIHSLVETQLVATANRLSELHGYSLKVNDLHGDAAERTKKYLTKVAKIQVGSDIGWQLLQDVAKLRNIIVHRRGRQGSERKDQKLVQQLTKKYLGEISLSGRPDDPEAELEVSLSVCKHFINETERIFAATGWPRGAVVEQLTRGERPRTRGNDMKRKVRNNGDEMRPEYEFDYSKAVRGKYYKRKEEKGDILLFVEPGALAGGLPAT